MNKPNKRKVPEYTGKIRYVGWFFHSGNDCAKGYHSVEFDTMDDLRRWEEKYSIKLFDISKEVKGERGRWYRI